MKKIVCFTSSLSYGGAEKMLCFVANGFVQRGYEVTILNLQEKKGCHQSVSDRIKIVNVLGIKLRYIAKLGQLYSLWNDFCHRRAQHRGK